MKMLHFIPITEQHTEELSRYYALCHYRVSDYSLGVKLMWRYMLESEFAIFAGCLVVRSKIRGRWTFDFPIAISEDADMDKAFDAMARFCYEHFLPFELNAVPQEMLPMLTARYTNIETRSQRNLSDYLYLAEDFREFAGKKYAGQRNHIRKFHAKYPNAVFREFTAADAEKITAFRYAFEKTFDKISYGAKNELERAWKMLRFIGSPFFRCGGFELDGKIISLCISEVCGDTLIDHIEKAFPEYEGVYPAMVQAFAKTFTHDVKYINREDDAGSRGLRTSKMQYQPVQILDKISVRVRSELYYIEKIPTIRTARLVMDAIRETDIPAYNRLCLDDERNRYWGYDYREDCETPDEQYFYLDQKKDFGSSQAMNFAIRLHETMIGELILYHFDFRGGVEIGVRILPEYEKNGYATEAYAAACEYALYGIGMNVVRGKCMKENLASKKMLSAILRPDGEDDTYFYFRKNV